MFSIEASVTMVAFLLCRQALGAALPPNSTNLASRNVPADPISKYTVQWFLDNVQQKPTEGQCIFYTSGLSEQAQFLAENSFGTSIWAVWSPVDPIAGKGMCDLYNSDTTDLNNPLRGIMADTSTNGQQRTYFTRMSEAYAQLCFGEADLMTDQPYDKIPQTGIWGKTEFPTLKKSDNVGGQVTRVFVSGKFGENLETLWERSTSSKRDLETRGNRINRRLTEPVSSCLTPAQIAAAFNDIDF